MTTEQKLNKLFRLLIDYGEGGLFRSDFNEELKELYREAPDTSKSEETKPDVTTSGEMSEVTHLTYGEIKYTAPSPPTPWLPNPGDGYYTVSYLYDELIPSYWGSPKPTKGELALYKAGLIFKTQEEAMAKINSLLNL